MINHFKWIRHFYKKRRDIIARFAEKHLNGSYKYLFVQIVDNRYQAVMISLKNIFLTFDLN